MLAVLTHENAPRVTTDYTGLMGMTPDPTIAVFQHDRVPQAVGGDVGGQFGQFLAID